MLEHAARPDAASGTALVSQVLRMLEADGRARDGTQAIVAARRLAGRD